MVRKTELKNVEKGISYGMTSKVKEIYKIGKK